MRCVCVCVRTYTRTHWILLLKKVYNKKSMIHDDAPSPPQINPFYFSPLRPYPSCCRIMWSVWTRCGSRQMSSSSGTSDPTSPWFCSTARRAGRPKRSGHWSGSRGSTATRSSSAARTMRDILCVFCILYLAVHVTKPISSVTALVFKCHAYLPDLSNHTPKGLTCSLCLIRL